MSGVKVLLSIITLLALASETIAADEPPDPVGLLGFESRLVEGLPCGWSAMPRDTAFVDSAVKYSGSRALRVERGVDRKDEFTLVSRVEQISFAGRDIELRAKLRSVGGKASLWLRQGNEKPLDFVGGEAVPETGEWVTQSIHMNLNSAARSLMFGLRYSGVGKAWIDELELYLDGRSVPIDPGQCRPTPLDTDRSFDHGSGIVLHKLGHQQLESLVLTAKVWGFLKYHHPALTGGARHWDYDLLRRLPKILAAKGIRETRAILVKWIDSLGVFPPCRDSCAQLDLLAPVRPRLSWIDDEKMLGGELRKRLSLVYANRVPNQQFFIQLASGAGNASFVNEPAYKEITYPDSGFQILAIFRFWNMVEYWSPYRDLIDENWDSVLTSSLLDLSVGMSRRDFELGMKSVVAKADDGHANLYIEQSIGPPSGECQLPVSLRFIDGQFVVESLLATGQDSTGFIAGDVLVALDAMPTVTIAEHARRFYGASNESARMRDIARSLTRGACGATHVKIIRDGEIELDARRVPRDSLSLLDLDRDDRAGPAFQMLTPKIGYLKLSAIKAAAVPEYVAELSSASAVALVVDIRNYPSDFVVFSLGSLLVDETTPFASFIGPSLSNPGMFQWMSTARITPAQPHFGGRVAILVDEISQSQAEYTAMALRSSPRAIVVGSQTAGANGNISMFSLPGGLRASLSGLGVFYADRTPMQQRGVKIDVPCSATIDGIRTGRDEVLECALHALEQPSSGDSSNNP